MAKNTAPKIERPCSTCSHLHEGIPCMEDGCECKVSTVAEIPAPVADLADKTWDAIEEARSKMTPEERDEADRKANLILEGAGAIAHETTPGTLEPFPGNPAVLFAGDATIQGRIGEVLAAYEDLGEPVGCELTTVDDKKFKWTGSEMVEVVAKPAAPAPEPTLTDEDVAKLREVVNAQNPATELPDGSVMVSVRVDADMLVVLKGWAEGVGEPWQTYLQRTIEMGLGAVVNGGSVAG